MRRESAFLRYTANTTALEELLGFLYAECCTRNKAIKPTKITQLCKSEKPGGHGVEKEVKSGGSMCYYSLYLFSNRLARDGEELVAYRFSSGCTGFISASDTSGPRGRSSASPELGSAQDLVFLSPT